MNNLPLVLDILLDEEDEDRIQNSKPGYLYTPSSQSLYPKHIRHIDYHIPNLAISYGKDNHIIINLEDQSRKEFIINHQNLDEFFSVALGVTDGLAMIAIGDSDHTRLQVVDVDQPLNVQMNTIYSKQEDDDFFPVPRYFSGTSHEAVLVYSDNSKLPINLDTFEVGSRKTSEVDQIIPSKSVLDPQLSILGPFVILTITPNLSDDQLLAYGPLIRKASKSSWIAVDEHTVIHTDLVDTSDFDDVIAQRRNQIEKLQTILSTKEDVQE